MTPRDTAIANACLQSIENFCMRANPETFRTELEKQGYVVLPKIATKPMCRAAASLDFSSQHDPTWEEYYDVMVLAAQETDDS